MAEGNTVTPHLSYLDYFNLPMVLFFICSQIVLSLIHIFTLKYVFYGSMKIKIKPYPKSYMLNPGNTFNTNKYIL